MVWKFFWSIILMIESETRHVAPPAGGALDVGIPPVGMLAGIEPEVGVLDVGVPLGGADGIVVPPLPCISDAHCCCNVGLVMIC